MIYKCISGSGFRHVFMWFIVFYTHLSIYLCGFAVVKSCSYLKLFFKYEFDSGEGIEFCDYVHKTIPVTLN